MKRLFAIFVSAAFVLSGVLVSCEKDEEEDTSTVTPGDSGDSGNTEEPGSGTGSGETGDGPIFTWAANPDFSDYDLGSGDIDVAIDIDAPNGISWILLTVGVDDEEVAAYIEESGIECDTAIDIISGDGVAALQEFGIDCGSSLSGATEATLDFTELALAIDDFAYKSFKVTLQLTIGDNEGYGGSATVTLTREQDTSPEIVWESNPDFEDYNIDIDSPEVDLWVEVPEGTAEFYFTVNTDNTSLNSLLKVVVGITPGTECDLINESSVVSKLKTLLGSSFPGGEELLGVTEFECDLTSLAKYLPSLTTSAFTGTIDLRVVDEKNQSVSKTVSLVRPDPTITFTWESNPDFEDFDLSTTSPDVLIKIDVPKGIETFHFSVSTTSDTLNNILSLAGVYSGEKYDVINDTSIVKNLNSLGIMVGPEYYHATHVEPDLSSLAEMLGLIVDESYTAEIGFYLTDRNGNEGEVTLNFYYNI